MKNKSKQPTQLKQHTMSVEATQEVKKHRSIFHRALSVFSNLQKRVPAFSSPVSLFLIRKDILQNHVPQVVSNHIQLMMMSGDQVVIKELQTQIPAEYIGVWAHFDKGQLKFRIYFRKQVEYVEKETISCLRSDSLDQLIDENLLRSYVP